MKPIEIINSRIVPGNFGAITLWPFIFYKNEYYKNDKCIKIHEHFHWYEALRWGVIPWYVTYLILKIFKKYDEHPFEKRAYKAEQDCRKELLNEKIKIPSKKTQRKDRKVKN